MIDAPFHLRLLGSPALTADDRTIQSVVAQPKRLALLAYLVVAPGGAQPRERLLALFWPESDDERARNSLSQALSYLRRSLGDDVIVASGTEVGIDPERVRCDVVAFREAMAAGRPADAVELFGAEFMDGFHLSGAPEFEAWVERERTRLREEMLHALLHVAAAAERSGEYAAAAERLRRGLELAPADERLVQGLLRVLARQGDRAGALAAYAAFRTRLAEEYRLEPSPETERLAAELPRAASSPSVAPAALEPTIAPASAPASEKRSESGSVVARLRPRTLAWVASGLLVIVTVVAAAQREEATPPPVDQDRVEVVAFENLTGEESLDRLGRIAADWVSQGIAQTGIVDVAPVGLDVWSGLGDRGGRGSGVRAGVRVEGSIHARGDSLRIQTVLKDARGRPIGAPDAVTVPATEPLTGIERVRQQVMAVLSGRFNPDMSAWGAAARPPTSFAAYQEFAAGMEFFVRTEYEAAQQRYMAAARLDSAYVLPLLWAIFAYRNAGLPAVADSLALALEPRRADMRPFERALLDFHLAGTRSDVEAQYQATRRLVRIAPDSEWLYLHALKALDSNRPYEAVETLLRADPDGGWLRRDFGSNYWAVLGRSLHAIGDYTRELEAVREGVRRYPSDFRLKQLEAHALAAGGRFEELDSLIATVPSWSGLTVTLPPHFWSAEATAHGYPDAGRRLAIAHVARFEALPEDARRRPDLRFEYVFALLGSGQPERARQVMGALQAEDPDAPWIIQYSGALAAATGDRETALRSLAWLEARELYYRQFFVLAALGEREEAVARLRAALARNEPLPISIHKLHVPWMLRGIWDYPPFVELVRPKDAPEDGHWPRWTEPDHDRRKRQLPG